MQYGITIRNVGQSGMVLRYVHNHILTCKHTVASLPPKKWFLVTPTPLVHIGTAFVQLFCLVQAVFQRSSLTRSVNAEVYAPCVQKHSKALLIACFGLTNEESYQAIVEPWKGWKGSQGACTQKP